MTGRGWWREGVLYQIYPRSFADANGDGVGDLRGILGKLDHLEWLGVDGVWLNPTYPSPNRDWGYDVADYCDVNPELGTLADLDELVAEAGRRGIAIVLDLVANHTSDRHAWFEDARSSRDSEHRDWYFWRDATPDGSPPNNWRSTFGGGSAWQLDERTGQMYLHHFLPEQPDLDWWNPEVRAAIEAVQRFWFDRGIAGFRIDVASELVKQRGLPDDDGEEQYASHADVAETHRVLRTWRSVADSYDPPRLLLGETWAMDAPTLARFHGEDDELQLAFNFPFMFAPLDAEVMRVVVEETEAAYGDAAWPVWTGSNHDFVRFPTRWCNGDGRKIRCALLMLLTLRGTPVLYYGDELGLQNVEVTGAAVLDVDGRDGARTPMQWSSEPGAGFTTAASTWLPLGDARSCNVSDQRDDPGSPLRLVRDLIALRRERAELRSGDYASVTSPEGTWVWTRGGETTVALNLSDRDAELSGVSGWIAIATERRRDGEALDGALQLAPWTGAVVVS